MEILHKNQWIIFFLVILTFAGCSKHKPNASNVILQTGEVKLNRDDWEKQLKKYVKIYKTTHKTDPPADSIVTLKNQFIDYSFILAGAYSKRYQFNKSVKDKILAVSKIMMCQKDGLLFKNKYESKVIITNQEIQKEILKSKEILTIYAIKFKDKSTMLTVLRGDTLIRDGKDFQKYVQRFSKKDGVSFSRCKLSFPSERFLFSQDIILKMNEGAVSKPIYTYDDSYDRCIYIFFLETKRTTTGLSGKEILKVKLLLEHLAQDKLYAKDIHRYLSQSGYTMNDSLIKIFVKQVRYGPRATIDMSSASNLINQTLVTYHVNGSERKIDVAYYVNYFNNYLPLRWQLRSLADYESSLKDIAIYDMEYGEAIKLGLTCDSNFCSSQRNYANNLIAEQFQQNELFKNIIVTDSAAMILYNLNKAAFKEADFAQVSVFIFDDFMKARRNMSLLQGPIDCRNGKLYFGKSEIKDIKSFHLYDKISFNSNLYDKKIVNQILNMKNNSLSSPIPINNKIYIFKKEKGFGIHIKTFDEVKDNIKMLLIKKKESEALKQYINKAKNEYKLVDYFRSDDYAIN